MGRSNCDLSLIGEPPCWGSGELPLFPQSWSRALSKVDLVGISYKSKIQKTFLTPDFCNNNWVANVRKLESTESDLLLGDLIVSLASEAITQDTADINIPILSTNLTGISGGMTLPFRMNTCNSLIEAGLYSERGITELLSGTYLELLQVVKVLSVALDFALTATAWLKAEDSRRPVFVLPESSDTLDGAFRMMRFRSVRNVGYSPKAGWYTSNFADVLGKRFGFDWQGRWTLDECGQDLHVTRERIRQIEKKALIALSPRSWGESLALNKVCDELNTQAGAEFYFTDSNDRVLLVKRIAIEHLLNSFGYEDARYRNISAPEGAQPQFGKSISEMRREAYKFSGKIGFVIEENLKTHFAEVYKDFHESKFELIRQLIAEKLNLPLGYIYVEPRNKSFFLSWTQNILSLQGDLHFDEYFDASYRYCSRRLNGVVHPPRSVVRAWLEIDPRFIIDEQEVVSIVEPIEVKLGETQEWLRDQIIEATGCVIHRAELMNNAREAGINSISIGVYCSYERYFKPIDTYCVTLTGMYPTQEFVDLAYMRASNLAVETTINNFKILTNFVVVTVTAGDNMCNRGFWSLNKPLATALGTSNFELRVDGQVVGRSSSFGATLTQWTSALAALGAVPGDKLKIRFDTELVTASIELVTDVPDLDDAD